MIGIATGVTGCRGEHDKVAHWSDFQSLVQLSVATNAAYSAIGAFIGNDVINERRVLKYLLNHYEHHLRLKNKPLCDDKGLPLKISIEGLIAECDFIDRRIEFLMSYFVRVVCIVGAVIGLICLYYGSEYANDDIQPWQKFLVIGLNVPFFIGLFVIMGASARTWTKISSKRQKIQGLLAKSREVSCL